MVAAKLRAPIVLIHGLLGFNQIRLCGMTLVDYFPEVPDFLRSSGNQVRVAQVSPIKGVADRAADLKSFLDQEFPSESVHILAHSMGGLDARYMISRLDMAERVLTLTTLGTPHRGSTFADWGVQRFGRVVSPVLEMFGVPHQAFYDLTTTSCKKFNEEVPDSPHVRYFSIAGRHSEKGWSTRMGLLNQFVAKSEGPNDGVVSVTSATYGESCEVWDGDHLSLVNWPEPGSIENNRTVDRRPDYARLVGRLADEGF